MPTICGFRRRGFTPEAIATFCETIGVAKDNSIVDMPLLEMCVREHLNRTTPRVMAVLRPLKVVLTNYPADQVEEFEAVNNPEDPAAGTRRVPFARELWIERDDFMENPPSKFYRLSPGKEVRLRYAYFIRCEEVVKDAAGNVVELRCTYDPATRGGDNPPDGRKVKATLHWVSARHALDAEVRLYDTLFTVRDPSAVAEGVDWKATLNPRSLETLSNAKLEPALASAAPESRWQFERMGYFVADRRDSRPGAPVFNRTVTLRDEWARIVKAGREGA
jgi:glutaminyl-tRNA synthetase